MEKKLVVSTFNCKNMKTSNAEILSLCKFSDVVLLQETWLIDFELPYLNSISNDFYAKGISSVDSSAGFISGRPHGGLAVMWRKSIAQQCNIIDYDDHRLMGIELISDSIKIQLINVYLPFNFEQQL